MALNWAQGLGPNVKWALTLALVLKRASRDLVFLASGSSYLRCKSACSNPHRFMGTIPDPHQYFNTAFRLPHLHWHGPCPMPHARHLRKPYGFVVASGFSFSSPAFTSVFRQVFDQALSFVVDEASIWHCATSRLLQERWFTVFQCTSRMSFRSLDLNVQIQHFYQI